MPRVRSSSRLRRSGASASRAAYAVGYESVPQFTREYGRMFGRPPMADARAARVPAWLTGNRAGTR